MSDLNNYFLALDTSKAHEDLEAIEAERKKTEEAIKKTNEEARKDLGKTWMKAVSVMQGTWASMETISRAMGVTIPTFYRTVISSVFSAAKILIPIFTAMEMTPATAIQGLIGLAQIGISISAAIKAQQEKTKAEDDLNRMNTYLSGVSSLIGVWSF